MRHALCAGGENSWQLAAGREREGSWQEAAGSWLRAGREQSAKGKGSDAMRHALCAGGGKNSGQEAAGGKQQNGNVGRCAQQTQ